VSRQPSGPFGTGFVTHGTDPLGIRDRVGGSLRYAIDVDLPGMVHAALVRSPIPSGRLLRLDTAAAAALPASGSRCSPDLTSSLADRAVQDLA
jgi:hypothetical protein